MKKFVTDPDPGQTLIRIRRVAEPEPEPPGAALFEPEPANHCYRFGLLTTSTGTDLESCAPCFLSVFVSIL